MTEHASTDPVESPDDEGDRSALLTLGVVAGIATLALITNVATLLASVLGTALVAGENPNEVLVFVATTLGTELSFLAVGAAFAWYRSDFELPVEPPSPGALRTGAVGLVAAFAVAFVSLGITDALIPVIEISPGYEEYSGLDELTAARSAVAVVLSLALIGPVEEFFFRGVVQGRLREALDVGPALVVAGVVFAVFHVYPVLMQSPTPAAVVHMVAYYTVVGVVFGWIYERTENLIVPAAVHGTFNALLFLQAVV